MADDGEEEGSEQLYKVRCTPFTLARAHPPPTPLPRTGCTVPQHTQVNSENCSCRDGGTRSPRSLGCACVCVSVSVAARRSRLPSRSLVLAGARDWRLRYGCRVTRRAPCARMLILLALVTHLLLLSLAARNTARHTESPSEITHVCCF
jgi:hypothetical protein